MNDWTRVVPPFICQSWVRSANAGLERGSTRFRQVSGAELARRLERSAQLVRVAAPLVERLARELPGSTNVAYLTDADGIVLCSAGDAGQITLFGLSPGYDWSEAAMGTNGAGTALATGKPVAVVGTEHFHHAFQNCTCTAAPIRGADGKIIGAIDVSSSAEDAYPSRLERVTRAAVAIAAALRG